MYWSTTDLRVLVRHLQRAVQLEGVATERVDDVPSTEPRAMCSLCCRRRVPTTPSAFRPVAVGGEVDVVQLVDDAAHAQAVLLPDLGRVCEPVQAADSSVGVVDVVGAGSRRAARPDGRTAGRSRGRPGPWSAGTAAISVPSAA